MGKEEQGFKEVDITLLVRFQKAFMLKSLFGWWFMFVFFLILDLELVRPTLSRSNSGKMDMISVSTLIFLLTIIFIWIISKQSKWSSYLLVSVLLFNWVNLIVVVGSFIVVFGFPEEGMLIERLAVFAILIAVSTPIFLKPIWAILKVTIPYRGWKICKDQKQMIEAAERQRKVFLNNGQANKTKSRTQRFSKLVPFVIFPMIGTIAFLSALLNFLVSEEIIGFESGSLLLHHTVQFFLFESILPPVGFTGDIWSLTLLTLFGYSNFMVFGHFLNKWKRSGIVPIQDSLPLSMTEDDILFLRPFKKEVHRMVRRNLTFKRLFQYAYEWNISLEELLVTHLSYLGRSYAMGSVYDKFGSGTKLPPIGAERYYSEQWEDDIRYGIRTSRLIVSAVGRSEAF